MLHGDLFPKDFIVSLDPPTNYMGADRIFDENGDLINAVRNINDYGDILPIRHKINHIITELPPSMYQAMCTFVLVIALRILRGQKNKHNSMLINASRFTNIQSKIRNILHEFMQDTERQIRFNYKKSVSEALENSRMRNLHDIWEKEFDSEEFSWEQVQAVLLDASAPIKIIEINSGSNDVLDYESYKINGLNVVAVGGFSLSRGLTLEGLSISYFLRNSIMYDTLMQMGRWFGFRLGYEDLCRVFMPSHAAGWYAHISGVIEELKTEFREMELANLTPKDFGLKIRSHPDSLIVTARNKMRTGEIVYRNIDLNEKLIETDKLFKAASDISHNRSMLENLVRKLCESKPYEVTKFKNYLWKDIPVDLATEFIQGYRNHQASIRTSTTPVLEHINRRKNDELISWNVVLINKDSAKDDEREQLCGISVGCERRSSGLKSDELSNCIIIGDKARVGSTSDEEEGLEPSELKSAEKQYSETPPDKRPNNITGLYYRNVRSRPLLIIHLLNIIREPKREVTHKGVVAYGISFPKSNYLASPVKYVVNTTWWKNEYGYDLEGDNND
jgi:hypothetical protein